ncbi:metallophosphoesterase [Sphingobacterium sp. SG20118]|uniref:metallophosphoesterase n=1 Tax=Sphingobacterium sp. SG20118 TaxID=3367156 RepID=UPI0037DFC7B0
MSINRKVALSILFSMFLLVGSALQAQEHSRVSITHQPYLQGLTDSTVHIIWTTNHPAISWVEIAPDDSTHFFHSERPKTFASTYGFKNVGTVHQVQLTGLKPGTSYRYRVYSQEVLKHEGTNVLYGQTTASDVYSKGAYKFKTSNPTTRTRFAVINDIHGRNEVMNNLLDQASLSKMDFVVFNGDMASSLLSEEQMYKDFMDTAIKRFASEKPMYYSRGNHETRGPFATQYPQYFPTPTGKLYYQFNRGDAAFIVLDCGEDKPDTDIEYSGIVDMDTYRAEQAKWLEQAIAVPSYKNAKYKVIICHMPPLGGWYGMEEMMKKFVPILNKSGAQVMLTGHLHKHIIEKANSKVLFPVIVNSNNNLVDVDLNEDKGTFKIIDQQGKVVEQISINPLR